MFVKTENNFLSVAENLLEVVLGFFLIVCFMETAFLNELLQTFVSLDCVHRLCRVWCTSW